MVVVGAEKGNHSSVSTNTNSEMNNNSSSKKSGLAKRSFVLFRDRPKETSPSTTSQLRRSWRRASRNSAPMDHETSSTEDTEKEASLTDAIMRTTVVPTTKLLEDKGLFERKDEIIDRFAEEERPSSCSGSTAILQHSYFKFLCGSSGESASSSGTLYQRKNALPDDPTIQESIECIFASQLEEGLPSLLLGDDEDEDHNDLSDRLVAPSTLQQSLFKSRCHKILEETQPVFKPKRQLVHSTLIHLQTVDSAGHIEVTDGEGLEQFSPISDQCACCRQSRPVLDPKHWPQRPLLLRPTPGSGTKIKGIRLSGSSEYIWTGEKSVLTWPSYLKSHWGLPESSDALSSPSDVMCDQCMILPINNGNEMPGESLVTDFYTDLFEGTLLLRLRKSEGTTPQKYDDSIGYFANMNRRYQVVIRGKFRKNIRWTECLTGFQLNRPCGKLPPKWMLNGALKVLSFFAPQLQANIDTKNPSTLSPLGSTPQCLGIEDSESVSEIDDPQSEPADTSKTLLAKASTATSSMQRARYRKKAFDKLFAQNSPTPVTDQSKVYTFEFLQHLINFDEFSVELGSVLGAIQLKELLDGQPLQIMASHLERKIWSFDIWHEMLVDDARRSDQCNA